LLPFTPKELNLFMVTWQPSTMHLAIRRRFKSWMLLVHIGGRKVEEFKLV